MQNTNNSCSMLCQIQIVSTAAIVRDNVSTTSSAVILRSTLGQQSEAFCYSCVCSVSSDVSSSVNDAGLELRYICQSARKESCGANHAMKNMEQVVRFKDQIAIGIVVPSKIPINNIKIRTKTQSFLSKFKTHQSDRSVSKTTKSPSHQTTFKQRSQSIQSNSSILSNDESFSRNSQRTLVQNQHKFSQLIPPIAEVVNHFRSRPNSSKISESESLENVDTPNDTVGQIYRPMLETLKSCDLNTMEILMYQHQQRGQTEDSQLNFINGRMELSRESSKTLHLNNHGGVNHKGTRAAPWFQFGKGTGQQQKRKLSRQQIIHKSINIESSAQQNMDKISDLSPMNVRAI